MLKLCLNPVILNDLEQIPIFLWPYWFPVCTHTGSTLCPTCFHPIQRKLIVYFANVDSVKGWERAIQPSPIRASIERTPANQGSARSLSRPFGVTCLHGTFSPLNAAHICDYDILFNDIYGYYILFIDIFIDIYATSS